MTVYYLAYPSTYFLEMLIAYMFFDKVSEHRKNPPVVLGFGFLMFEAIAAVDLFIVNIAWINILLSFIVTALFALFFFELKRLHAIFFSALLCGLSTGTELCFALLIFPLMNISMADYLDQPLVLIVSTAISKTCYFIIVLLISRFSVKSQKNDRISLMLTSYPLITAAIFFAVVFIGTHESISLKSQFLLSCVCLLLLIATISLTVFLNHSIDKDRRLVEIETALKRVNTETVYYGILKKQNEELRAYAHDTKKHLNAINSINKDPEIKKYLNKISDDLVQYSKVSHSGNIFLDVIIDRYVNEGEQSGINFSFDVKNNNLSILDSTELITVLGNLLDNAFEAAVKTKEKNVLLETDFRNEFTVIIVSNSCEEKPEFDKDGMPVTTKKNKKMHGIGLKNVKRIVKKSNGDIMIKYDEADNLFVTELFFSPPPKIEQ